MSTFKEKLAKAKLPRRTVEICFAGDLTAEFERLERRIAEERQSQSGTSMEEASPLVELAEAIEAVRQQMRDASHEFILQALPGPRYRALKAEHPPRQDDDGTVVDSDKVLDANLDTFSEALLRACLIDPEVADDASWSEIMNALTDRQYDDLVGAAIFVNEGRVSVPFSRAASAILQTSSSE